MTLWQKITGLLRPRVGTKAKATSAVAAPETRRDAVKHVGASFGRRVGTFNAIGNKLSAFDVYCLARQAGAGSTAASVKAWRDKHLFVLLG
jgi:hypothetical protein